MSTTDTQPLAPASAAPRPPRKWYRRPRNIVLMSVAGLIAVGAISSAAGGSSRPAASAPPQSSTSAPAVPAPKAETPKATTPAPAPSRQPSLAEKVTTWLAGPGGQAFANVQSDIATITTDAGNYDLAAVQADGSALARDAAQAVRYPLPVATDSYAKAMRHYEQAGIDMKAGEITAATADLNLGNADLNQCTKELNAAGSSITA